MLVAVRVGTVAVAIAVSARIAGIHADSRLQQDYREYRSRLVTITGTRGRILDRNGRLLAANEMTYTVTVDPGQISDETRVLLKMQFSEQFPDLDETSEITAVVSSGTMKRMRILEGVKGVSIRAVPRRIYPMGMLGGPMIGHKGIAGGRGLEYILDALLEGRPGLLPATSRLYGESSFLGGKPPMFSGNDVVLTVDVEVQGIAEESLARAVEDSGAVGGAAFVLDLQRGEYLALASEPRYNPNAPETAEYEVLETGERVKKQYPSGGEPWDWKPLQWGFEPGSTLKPVVIAIAIETGLVDPAHFEFTCTGTRTVADRTIREFNNEVHGHIDLKDVIAKSCNLGASVIGETIPKEIWKPWVIRLGLGQPATELDEKRVPIYSIAERVPVIRENWNRVDRANRGFGQGIEVTPVQLARLYTPFALRGVQLTPCWIREIRTPAGAVHWRCRPGRTVVFSEETAEWIRGSLEAVVARGTGVAAQIPGIRIAGKTGTAQKAVPVDAKGEVWTYSREKLVTSFIGFFPAEKPRYMVGVFLNEPKGKLASGGKFAAPAFREIAYKLAWRDNLSGGAGKI